MRSKVPDAANARSCLYDIGKGARKGRRNGERRSGSQQQQVREKEMSVQAHVFARTACWNDLPAEMKRMTHGRWKSTIVLACLVYSCLCGIDMIKWMPANHSALSSFCLSASLLLYHRIVPMHFMIAILLRHIYITPNCSATLIFSVAQWQHRDSCHDHQVR